MTLLYLCQSNMSFPPSQIYELGPLLTNVLCEVQQLRLHHQFQCLLLLYHHSFLYDFRFPTWNIFKPSIASSVIFLLFPPTPHENGSNSVLPRPLYVLVVFFWNHPTNQQWHLPSLLHSSTILYMFCIDFSQIFITKLFWKWHL